MTRILIPPIALHGGQQRILESPARYNVIAAGRRFGKTLLAVEWLALMDGGGRHDLVTLQPHLLTKCPPEPDLAPRIEVP